MHDRKVSRGLPLPSFGLLLAIVAGFLGAWLVWSKYGQFGEDAENDGGGNPVKDLRSIEASVKRGKAAVPELIAALDSTDSKERGLAVYGLGRIGADAVGALEKIREQLADDDGRVRSQAISALATIDPNREAAAAVIAPLLADSDNAVRETARKELCQFGPAALKPILEILHSDLAVARLEAVQTLRNTFMSVQSVPWVGTETERLDAIRGVADDPDPEVRIEAITLAAEHGRATIDEIKELLHGTDQMRVNVAIVAVAKLGDDSGQVLPDVLAILDDRLAADSLGSVLGTLSSMKLAGHPAADRLAEVGKRYHDRHTNVSIARTLHDIGAEDEQVASVLIPLLLDPHDYVSWPAGQTLVELCPNEARRQVSLMLPKLGTNETGVNKQVLYALQALGPQAEEAVPALIPLLKNSDPLVAEFAAHALNAAGPAAAQGIPSLADVVCNDSLPNAQRLACAMRWRIGPPAQGVVPELLEVINKAPPEAPRTNPSVTEWDVRAAIIHALGRIGGDEKKLVGILQAQLSSSSQDVRAASADALGRVAKQSPDVLTELIRRLRRDNAFVGALAALAIGRMECDRAKAVTPLGDALSNENDYVRTAAAISLGKIGPAAKSALPALREVLADRKSSGVRGGSWPHWWTDNPEFISVSFDNAVRTAIAEIEQEPDAAAPPE